MLFTLWREFCATIAELTCSIQQKPSGEIVTEADLEVDRVLRHALCRGQEGWLSEETVDDYRRLRKFRTWIVDPLDGTN